MTRRTAVCLPVLARLVGLELVPDHAHHDVVRDEPTGIHDLLSFDTKSCLLRDLLTQHITCCEVADAKLVAYPRCLCALAYIHTRHKQGKAPLAKKNALHAVEIKEEVRQRALPRVQNAPAPGGPMRMVRSCCAGEGVGFLDAAFTSSSLILSVSWPTRDLR